MEANEKNTIGVKVLALPISAFQTEMSLSYTHLFAVK